MSHRRSKKLCQRNHAKRRAFERFGWLFNRHELFALGQQIEQGKGKFVGRQSNRVTVWDLQVKGETVRVVYDKNQHQIVTFLPKQTAQGSVTGREFKTDVALSFNGRTPGSLPDNAGSTPAGATIIRSQYLPDTCHECGWEAIRKETRTCSNCGETA